MNETNARSAWQWPATARLRLFFSYRRLPSVFHLLQMMRDRMMQEHGTSIASFLDQDTMRLGEPFPEQLQAHLESTDVLVAVIGKDWFAELNRRAGENTEDWVARELRIAKNAGKKIVPLFIDRASSRDAKHHPPPEDLAYLVQEHGMNFEPYQCVARFDEGVSRFIQQLLRVHQVDRGEKASNAQCLATAIVSCKGEVLGGAWLLGDQGLVLTHQAVAMAIERELAKGAEVSLKFEDKEDRLVVRTNTASEEHSVVSLQVPVVGQGLLLSENGITTEETDIGEMICGSPLLDESGAVVAVKGDTATVSIQGLVKKYHYCVKR